MKRLSALLLLAVLSACATVVEDPDCRSIAQIIQDPDHYEVCLIQKGLK